MMKPQQSIVKRFIKTKCGKILHRTCGQDHFNARESGKITKAKRRDRIMSRSFRKTILRYL